MFQTVMDQEARRSLGAHYTSEENIFKVIRPLFLDELESELDNILDSPASSKDKIKALKEYQDKLASLGFLDPACGSGNFLIIAYRELRRLETRALVAIREIDPQKSVRTLDVSQLSKVSIDQFHGIEILEFPVDIARISLHLMEHVMNLELGKACGLVLPTIPLKHSGNIVCANALTIDWKTVVDPKSINYILGNPPYGGAKHINATQKKDLFYVFKDIKYAGSLDFVSCWFKKAADYIRNTKIEVSFVTTNSICQGIHVIALWSVLNKMGINIRFAYKTFKWKNDASHNAAVHCAIIGFCCYTPAKKFIYLEDNSKIVCKNINAYLIDAKDEFISRRDHPICDVPEVGGGNQPIDGGFYLFSEEQKKQFIEKEPGSKKYFRIWLGGDEFINGWRRYCLWLGDSSDEELINLPECRARVEQVRKYRLTSPRPGTRKLASTPKHFNFENMPSVPYIVIPEVSTERRFYIPIDFINNKKIICSNKLRLIPNATLYHFAILTSNIHMVWMKTVCCRLKSDYSYSNNIVYNNFPWPDPTEDQKQTVSDLAQTVLDIRDDHVDMSLGKMYNPETMPDDLKEAHHALDVAVDKLYNSKGFASDEERLKTLFRMYADLTKSEKETNNA